MFPDPPPTDACLFLDVDGTLIDIAPTPDAVRIPAGLIGDLASAERALGGALALVSGRRVSDLDGMFAPLRLAASGVHGAEFRFQHDTAALWAKAEPIGQSVWNDLLTMVEAFPGTLVENKGYSFAVHYRAVPRFGARLHEALGLFLADRADLGLVILPGHFVFELKRPGIDKGGAIMDFMSRAPFAGRRPVFIGDDVTDVPGFAAARRHRGWAYSVRSPYPEVDGTFVDPAAVRGWLADIARRETSTA